MTFTRIICCLFVLGILAGACGGDDSNPEPDADAADTPDTADTSDTPDTADTSDTPDSTDTPADGEEDDAADLPDEISSDAPVDGDGDTFPEGEDCDDDDADVFPGATESCNGVDDNCDGTTDEPTAIDAVPFFRDADEDAYGDPTDTVLACAAPTGYVIEGGDCADDDAAINPGETDLPDLLGIDTNCDVVDGDLSLAVFVSVDAGDDAATGLGTLDADGTLTVDAVETLARALEIADACDPKCYVLMAEGTYDQVATPLVLREGVSLYGGFDASWARGRPSDATVITATASPTVRADALTLDTVVELLTIQGPNVTVAGGESVALLVAATSTVGRLTLRAVDVRAGQGGPGTAGAVGTSTTCTCAGGAGGTSTACATTAGTAGACGAAAGGTGGTSRCRLDCFAPPGVVTNGADGGDGTPAAVPSSAGTASSNVFGSFSGADWLPTAGGDGAAGNNGAGGGGGGGGGWWQNYCAMEFCVYDFTGGTGGNGGNGGCAGSAGTGGGQGGGAFGVVLIDSLVRVETVDIALGSGGAGGNGGNGGDGTAPATGVAGGAGATGTCGILLGAGGNGGSGGDGGRGSGGSGAAGGNGGPSLGLALVGAGSNVTGVPSYDASAALAGSGGAAGTGGLQGGSTTRSPGGRVGLSGTTMNFRRF